MKALSRAQRARLLDAVERWKKRIYPNLPGEPPTWPEWLDIGAGLIAYRNDHAKHIDAAPLRRVREMVLARANTTWHPTRDEVLLVREADAAVNDLKQSLLGDGKAVGRLTRQRGAPHRYPKALAHALTLLGKPSMTDPRIYRLCKDKFGTVEPIPKTAESFMRTVRNNA